MRVPLSWMTGLQVDCRTSAPVMGSWLKSLDAQQAPVGGVADLPQRGQIGQPFAEAEVHGVVDGGLGAQRPSFLVVLLDLGGLVEHVQARGDPVGDDTGGEGAGSAVLAAAVDAAAEDQADPVGAAQVQVVADDLLEEDPPGDRLIQHLGQGELRLEDRDVIPVPGRPVGGAERMRQERQPFTQQRVDLGGAEGVADRLQGGRVIDGGERVVQRGEAEAGLGRLALGPLIAIDAQLGVEREVATELQEERAEVLIDAVAVEVVDYSSVRSDPRVGTAVLPAALAGAEHRRLFLRPADEQHPFRAGEAGQELMGHVVLALPLRSPPTELRKRPRRPAQTW